MKKTKIGPRRSAFADITAYLKSKISYPSEYIYDNPFVTPSYMNTKETRRLNKELGLHKLNKSTYVYSI
tara:strand:+ start:18503 stop:18709 length:207 start_codon:yes stop_codon:yes gene_type:complete